MIRLRPEVRKHVRALCDLAEYANRRDDGQWSWQSSDDATDGVYGSAVRTIDRIVREEYGQYVLDEINNSRYGYNFGGNGDYLEDVEWAIYNALQEIRSRAIEALCDYADMY